MTGVNSNPAEDLVLVDCSIFTAFGPGRDLVWRAMMENRHAFVPCRRFHNDILAARYAALAPELDDCPAPSDFFLDFFTPLARRYAAPRTALYLASTVGEIECLDNSDRRCTSDSLLEKAAHRFQIPDARLISAACASANAAVCRAAAALSAQLMDVAFIYAADYVSEFVCSGFATLKAMSPSGCARPYDRDRDGLLLGDAAGVLVLTSAAYAAERCYPVLARLSGWGMSCDAGHITAPIVDGEFLARAVSAAMNRAGLTPDDVGAVIGHGTGTRYNDAMEIHAIQRLFQKDPPLFSVKGSTGHTLAASGLVQTAVALNCLENDIIPPQTSLQIPEPGAENMLSTHSRPLAHRSIVSMNAGFGGLNAVVIWEAPR